MTTSAGKNIWYVSISTIIPAIFTFLFWFVTAKMYGAAAVGVASSLASLVIIITTIDVLDMHLGMKRPLGIAFSSRDIGRFKQILTSTVVFVSTIVIISIVLIAIPNLRILETLSIDRQYTWIVIAMLFAQPFQYIFAEALIAALQSRSLVMPYLLGSLSRFPILFGVSYLFNTPTIVTTIAYSSTIFISSAFFAVYSIKIFRGSQVRATQNIYSNIKHILNASLSSWIPNTLHIFGYLFGIITVFSVVGASEGGKLYIVMGIFLIILFIVSGITRVTHSLIAGMDNDKQRTNYLSYSIEVAFLFTMPLAMPMLFFANNFLGLMGKEFSSAASAMSIFIISLPMVIISKICEEKWCIARISTVFGIHKRKKSLPPLIIEKLRKNESVKVIIDQYTSPTYALNLANMLKEIIDKKINGIIHASGASRLSRYEQALKVCRLFGLNEELILSAVSNEMNWKAKRPNDSSLNVDKACKVLQNKPKSFDQALKLFSKEIHTII